MKVIVNIGSDNCVAMTDDQLLALNELLKQTPVVNRYDGDKEQSGKRIKLEAALVVKTKTYDVV